MGSASVALAFFSQAATVMSCGGDYMTNDDSGKDRFLPIFPASCPWVTSVSGTRSYKPETGASFSGGGFSNYFPREEYQMAAVKAFLEKLGGTYDGLYSTSAVRYPPWGPRNSRHRRTVDQLSDRPSRVTFGYDGHKLLSAHASFPSLPSSLSRPSSGILLTAHSQKAADVAE
ncbi:hypothetical protein EDB83DRAFT_2618052 [Lactarius deliciosus]|nr:hypothetical protein EDB83DRAFT_2618052 [Lactarius deliciosus]